MKEIRVIGQKGKRKKVERIGEKDIKQGIWQDEQGNQIDSQHMLISMLLPPAVKAFFNELETEVKSLCGKRYSRETENQRWGSQNGSIVLGNQQVAMKKPRVRSSASKKEIPLSTYERFQDPSIFDERVFQEGIKHVSQRDYAKGLPRIASSFGISKSSISRRWIKATGKKLEELQNRDLTEMNIIAVLIDGKRFSSLGVIVALGVGEDGKKHVLGLYQSSTEHSSSCLKLLENLEKRGLPQQDILFVVDGGSGLNKALEDKYQVHDREKRTAVRLRCNIHKWNNLKKSLDENGQKEAGKLFWALREARDIDMANSCSDALESCLRKHNLSAYNSYMEARDDILMIHRLGLNLQLRKFFSTTNAIESLNSLLEEDLRRVKRWRNSDHFQRWVATACLQNEKRMRRIKGFIGLAAMKIKIQNLCTHDDIIDNNQDVA